MKIPAELYNYIAAEENYPSGGVIISEGGYSSWAHLILEGKVKVRKQTPRGQVTLYTLKEGEIIGEMTLLKDTKGKHTASVIADGDVMLGLLNTNKIIDDLNSLSPQLRKFISTLANRLEDATARVTKNLKKYSS
jgi:CRP-like cAMP-binding protein